MRHTRRLWATITALVLVGFMVGPWQPARAATIPVTVTLSPDSGLTLAGKAHRFSAEVTGSTDDPALQVITFFVSGNANAGRQATCPVTDGTATWDMIGYGDGTDSVVAYYTTLPEPPTSCEESFNNEPQPVGVPSNTVSASWVNILVTQETTSTPVGDQAVFHAEIYYEGNTDVTFFVNGVGQDESGTVVRTVSQVADLSYTTLTPGTDRVFATFDDCGDGCQAESNEVTHTWTGDVDVALSPSTQTNLVNTYASYTADVSTSAGPVGTGYVCFYVSYANGSEGTYTDGHERVEYVQLTSEDDGEAYFSYSAYTPGDDHVVAHYFLTIDGEVGCPSPDAGGPSSAVSLQHWYGVLLDPSGTQSAVNVAHQLTATVLLPQGDCFNCGRTTAPTVQASCEVECVTPICNGNNVEASVTFTVVSGPGAGETDTEPVDTCGDATASFTSAEGGESTYKATYNGDDSNLVTHTWVAETPPSSPPPVPTSATSLTLSPTSSSGDVGATHVLTAVVTTVTGAQAPARLPGATVVFTQSSGPSLGWPRTALTDAQGIATISYTSALPGSDVVVATVGPSATSNLASRTWNPLAVVLPTPTPIPTPTPPKPTLPPVPPVVVPTVPPVVIPTVPPVVVPVPPVIPPVEPTTPTVVEPTPTPVETTPAPVPTPTQTQTEGFGSSTVTLDSPSTLPGGEASLTGASCPAGSPVTALINGTVVGTATADANGAYNAKLNVPDLPIGQYQVQIRCGAKTGAVALDLVVSTAAPFNAASAATTGLILVFFVLLLLLYLGNAKTGAGRVKPTPAPDDEPWTPFSE